MIDETCHYHRRCSSTQSGATGVGAPRKVVLVLHTTGLDLSIAEAYFPDLVPTGCIIHGHIDTHHLFQSDTGLTNNMVGKKLWDVGRWYNAAGYNGRDLS